MVDGLVAEVRAGKDISCSDYPGSSADVEMALRIQGVHGKRLLVGGSISPWVESVALALGVESITTSDYNPALSRHPKIQTIGVPALLQKIYGSVPAVREHYQFDVVVSYSSVEHDGLGRYGDPLNPEGDFHAMQELWDVTRPGGVLLLAVPAWYQDFVMYIRYTGRAVLLLLPLPPPLLDARLLDCRCDSHHGPLTPELTLRASHHPPLPPSLPPPPPRRRTTVPALTGPCACPAWYSATAGSTSGQSTTAPSPTMYRWRRAPIATCGAGSLS